MLIFVSLFIVIHSKHSFPFSYSLLDCYFYHFWLPLFTFQIQNKTQFVNCL